MRPSPVRLEHYNLTSLSITPTENYSPNFDEGLYPKFSAANFNINVRLGEPMEDGDDEYLIHLDLSATPKESKSFPYSFSVGADAIITFHGKEPDAIKMRDLVMVNGASMVYSALREILFSLTCRFSTGPMMLPSANFLDLRDGLKTTLPVEKKVPTAPPPEPLKKIRAKRIKS